MSRRRVTTLAQRRPEAKLPAAARVLDRATAYWRATNMAGEYLRDLTGNGHDARFGSAGTARVFGMTGRRTGYLRLPDRAGNYASVPDSAALDVTGDLDLRADLVGEPWAGAGESAIIGKYHTTGDQRSYLLTILTSGVLRLYWSPDGTSTALRQVDSTAAVPFGNGERGQVRATLDVDDGGNHTVTFYTRATDADPWAILGSAVTTAGTTSIHAGTHNVEIGTFQGGTLSPFGGRVFRAQIFAGLTGADKRFDVDMTDLSDGATSFTASTGQTVTVNSTDGADSNDPKVLTFDPALGKYVATPGDTTNFPKATVPTNLVATGNLSVRVEAEPDDWTPAAEGRFVYKTGDTFAFLLLTNGTLRLWAYDDTLTLRSWVSTVPVPFSNGEPGQVRFDLDLDDGAGNSVGKFYTRAVGADLDDDAGWTQLGADRTTVALTGLRDNGTDLTVGYGLPGKVWKAWVESNGAVVAEFDAALLAEPYATVADPSTGRTWTLQRSTSGRKLAVVDRTLLLFGTDDYLEVADHPDLDVGTGIELTVVALVRLYHPGSKLNALLTKESAPGNTNPGYNLQASSDGNVYMDMADGTNRSNDSRADPEAGRLAAVAGVRRATEVEVYVDAAGSGTPTADATGDLSNAHPLQIGRFAGGSSPLDGEVVAAAIFPEALTDEDVAAVGRELRAAA